jgi:hypothetical protein
MNDQVIIEAATENTDPVIDASGDFAPAESMALTNGASNIDPLLLSTDYTATQALALTSDVRQFPTDPYVPPRIVPVTDPAAAFFLVPAGGKLPKVVTDALGLTSP